ncbi:MAG: FAD-binding oxidoreductase [Sphingobacteriales bacterium]|nr:FAD-binding oxidoreductase [Sphingobacteriales bacterium]
MAILSKFNPKICQHPHKNTTFAQTYKPTAGLSPYCYKNAHSFLIVGQGLTGTWLSHYLLQAQQSVLVVDEYQAMAASRVASGVINPITGKYMTQTWLADQLLPFAFEQYQHLETLFSKPIFVPTTHLLAHQQPTLADDCQRLLKNKTEHFIKIITTDPSTSPLRPM